MNELSSSAGSICRKTCFCKHVRVLYKNLTTMGVSPGRQGTKYCGPPPIQNILFYTSILVTTFPPPSRASHAVLLFIGFARIIFHAFGSYSWHFESEARGVGRKIPHILLWKVEREKLRPSPAKVTQWMALNGAVTERISAPVRTMHRNAQACELELNGVNEFSLVVTMALIGRHGHPERGGKCSWRENCEGTEAKGSRGNRRASTQFGKARSEGRGNVRVPRPGRSPSQCTPASRVSTLARGRSRPRHSAGEKLR